MKGSLLTSQRSGRPQRRWPLTPTLSPLRGARGNSNDKAARISMAVSAQYVPGVCNIGTDEIRHRRRLGLIAAAFTLACATGLVATGAAASWYLVLFFPAAGTAISLIQARARFCVHFGRLGLFNFATRGATQSVGAATARRADRAKAVELIRLAALYGAGFALVAFVLALVVRP